ncbi:MAG TPA: hypothetical protein VJ728_04310 [Candidatus Binataceae bacterium]|nr:hypothetical protein [Candidatus Binataceae bacterium]
MASSRLISPLEFAVVLTAVHDASRFVTQIQEKIDCLTQADQLLTAIGERIAVIGRSPGDLTEVGEWPRSAIRAPEGLIPLQMALPFTTDIGQHSLIAAQSQHETYAARTSRSLPAHAEFQTLHRTTFAAKQSDILLNPSLTMVANSLTASLRSCEAVSTAAEILNVIRRRAVAELSMPVTSGKNHVFDLTHRLGNLANGITPYPGSVGDQIHVYFPGHHGALPEALAANAIPIRTAPNSARARISTSTWDALQTSGKPKALNVLSRSRELFRRVLPLSGADIHPNHRSGMPGCVSWGVINEIRAALNSFSERINYTFVGSGQSLWMSALDNVNRAAAAIRRIEYQSQTGYGPAGLFNSSPLIEGPTRVLRFHPGEKLTKNMNLAPVIAPTVDIAGGMRQLIAIPADVGRAVTRPPISVAVSSTPVLSVPLSRGKHEAPTQPFRARSERSRNELQPITFNVNYTINPGSPDDWVKAARSHADELMRIIDAKLTRRARLQFT